MELLTDGIAWVVASLGFDTRFIDALPTAFMKPLSAAVPTMMVESMKTFGPDSFTGRLSCCSRCRRHHILHHCPLFRSVGIKNTVTAVVAGLIADLAGVIAAVLLAYLSLDKSNNYHTRIPSQTVFT
jgi:spore maturation protein SpmB